MTMSDRDTFDERVQFTIGKHTPITFKLHGRGGVAAWSSSNVEVRITVPQARHEQHHSAMILILLPLLGSVSKPGNGKRLVTCVRTNIDDALVEANLSDTVQRSRETFTIPRAVQVSNCARSDITSEVHSASLTFASETAKQVFLGHIMECWDARRIMKVMNEAHTWDEGWLVMREP
ncbi:hypothetical protein K474DRAFT_1676115 [Panus rudis PR-1116 ss-1]|nr:hypothetical protein K474DRAFT_1676115 [Panus rudis PR-1116 ss-1]